MTCRGRRLLRQLPALALMLAVAALLLLAAGPLGWRAGWWHYRVGLQILMPYAFYIGIAAVATALLALGPIAVRRGARQAVVLAVLGLLGGAVAAYIPWHWNSQRGLYPRLNDVTTDFDNPPSLAFAERMRRAEHGNPASYGGTQLAAVQRKAYPDIAPAMLDLPADQAFDRALAIARKRGWTIVEADRTAGTIDAEQRSRWFGFTDDIAIRITPAEDGSRIDIRSAARQGRGDYGVNAARGRAFLAALRNAGATQ